MENYHVKKHQDHLDLTKEDAAHAAISKPTKLELISAMQTFVKGKTASVKIHGEGGRFREKRTYQRSSDPKQSAG